jgi:hypothetical protein
MKINRKALQLIEKGLSSRTVSKLTESQIDVLHSKLLGEQVTTVPTKPSYKVGPQGGELPPSQKGYKINKTQTGDVVATTNEELDEEDEVTIDPNKDTETQDAHQVGPSTDDGFGNYNDGNMSENKKGPNPWAICHAQVGPKKSRKWERCVMSVKKQLKEGKNPVSLFLESQIEKIVEKHLPPRITKGDLLKVISETSTTAPVKEPITKPTTKPRIRPAHPGQNPHPGEKEAPRAKKSETKESTTAPVKEPITKPTTKPRIRPAHPGQNPHPGEKEAPRAISPEQAKDNIIDAIMKLLEK